MKRIIIIDGNSLINRAYYAMQKPMITQNGIYTQGIYGFINMLNKLEEDYSPEYMAVAFDLKAPTFRHKEYPEYKAGRKPMPPELAMEMPLLKDVLRAMNIAVLELEGYEADDILGTVSKTAEIQGIEPLIVTGDRDSFQLASDITKIIYTKRGVTDFDLYDRQKMLERYSMTPEQFIDLKAIMGDSSDNIPGIPGIGEKGGIELITQFGSVDNMLSHTDQIKKPAMRSKVETNAELCRKSKWLATIDRDVPLKQSLEDMIFGEPDYKALTELYQKLEFKSFLKRLKVPESALLTPVSDVNFEDYNGQRLIISNHEALDSLDLSGGEYYFSFIGEFKRTDNIIPHGAILISQNAYYFDFDRLSFECFTEFFNKQDIAIFGHDIKSDIFVMIQNGIKVPRIIFDTAVSEYCLEVNRSDYGLNLISMERLGYSMPDEDAYTGTAQIDMFTDSLKPVLDYNILKYNVLCALIRMQKDELNDRGLKKIFYDIELPLVETLASMEAYGISCDVNYLDEFGKSLESEITNSEQKIYDSCGMKFNIKSPKQLGEVLFENLKLPHGKKNKSGYSTSADILEKLKDDHPVIPLILEYRNLTKLKSTYIDGMKPLIASDGRIHCNFRQTVTTTGRISCTEPNLQNIPVRQEPGRKIRKAFKPGDGYVFVGADYSQIELRVLAHLSQDSSLIDAFNNGEDIHKMTASRVLGIPQEEVTPLDRSRAKAVNFGVIYGMSGFGLSEEINTTRKDAENYIKEYFNKHPGVKSYMDLQKDLARQRGYSETILGRKRPIPEITASAFMVRQLGERLAMNTPIQGSAADIIKIAMNKVYCDLKAKWPESHLILQIHDELIIEARESDVEAISALLKEDMEDAMNLLVRLDVDLNTANNWYDLK